MKINKFVKEQLMYINIVNNILIFYAVQIIVIIRFNFYVCAKGSPGYLFKS